VLTKRGKSEGEGFFKKNSSKDLFQKNYENNGLFNGLQGVPAVFFSKPYPF
jgi:hypothetical protein